LQEPLAAAVEIPIDGVGHELGLAIDRNGLQAALASANGVWIATAQGAVPLLTDDPQVTGLVFTADGKSVIYSAAEKVERCADQAPCTPAPGPFYHLTRLDIATHKATVLVPHVRDLRDIKVAPRGGLISFISRPTAQANGDSAEAVLQLYHPDTGAITAPVNLNPNGQYAWSPDGQTLALLDGDSPSPNSVSTVFSVAADGTAFKTLGSNLDPAALGPFFSADGQSVRMIARDTHGSLWVQELHEDKSEGRGFRIQLSDKWTYHDWQVSPDGTLLLAPLGTASCPLGISTIDLDGKGSQRFYPGVSFGAWLGDGARFFCRAPGAVLNKRYFIVKPAS
jgi:hypothetical protein